MVGVGLIGAGIMGSDHARILASSIQDAALVAIADADKPRAEAIASRVPGCRVLADGFAVVGDPKVDAVLIASPDQTHRDLVLACLAAGKPVLCEKPLAPSGEGCLQVCAAEAKQGRRLVQVGFMRRFDPSYTAMKAELDGGNYGKPVLFRCIHRNANVPDWFDSNMLITNSAVHEFDISRWLLGREVETISVFPANPPPSDAGHHRRLIVLETADGIVIDIEAFLDARYGYDVRAELACENGTISLVPKAQVHIRTELRAQLDLAPDWRGHFFEAYRIELQAWIKAIQQGKSVGASAWDGYVATAMAEAGVAANQSGKRERVRIEPKPKFYA